MDPLANNLCRVVHDGLDALGLRAGIDTNLTTHLKAAADVILNSPIASLPLICAQGMRPVTDDAVRVAAGWILAGASSAVLDSALDELSIDHLMRQRTVATATSLLVTAADVLEHLVTGPAVAEIRREFWRVGLTMIASQYAEASPVPPSLAQSWTIANQKSGAFFELGASAAARLLIDDIRVIEGLQQFGRHLGLLKQARNDLAGLTPEPTDISDLYRQRWSNLAIAYVLSLEEPALRRRLIELILAGRTEARQLEAARTFIVERGAILYLQVEMERHALLAEQALQALPLHQEQRLWLSETVSVLMDRRKKLDARWSKGLADLSE